MILMLSTIKTLIQGSIIFSLEVQIVNILGSVNYMVYIVYIGSSHYKVSDAMTQFYHYSVKASIENRL